MRSLKSRGVEDVSLLRRRVRRLLALGRIYPADADYITKRLNEVEAKIVSMHETDEYGKEEE